MDAVQAAALLNEIARGIEGLQFDSAELRAAVQRVSIAFCSPPLAGGVVSITQPTNDNYIDALSAELQRCVLEHVVEGHIGSTTAPARGILSLSMAARRFAPSRWAPLEDACRAACLRAPKTSLQQLWEENAIAYAQSKFLTTQSSWNFFYHKTVQLCNHAEEIGASGSQLLSLDWFYIAALSRCRNVQPVTARERKVTLFMCSVINKHGCTAKMVDWLVACLQNQGGYRFQGWQLLSTLNQLADIQPGLIKCNVMKACCMFVCNVCEAPFDGDSIETATVMDAAGMAMRVVASVDDWGARMAERCGFVDVIKALSLAVRTPELEHLDVGNDDKFPVMKEQFWAAVTKCFYAKPIPSYGAPRWYGGSVMDACVVELLVRAICLRFGPNKADSLSTRGNDRLTECWRAVCSLPCGMETIVKTIATGQYQLPARFRQ